MKENHSTYSKALLEYIVQEDSQFPAVKQAEILCAKRGDRGIDETEGATMTGNLEHTPTEHRSNDANKIVIDGNQQPLKSRDSNDKPDLLKEKNLKLDTRHDTDKLCNSQS